MKFDWNRRSTYMIVWVAVTGILGIIAILLVNPEYARLAACITISSLVFDMAMFSLIMHFFPNVKRWWFGMEV